jgi:HlyD family secretion protein
MNLRRMIPFCLAALSVFILAACSKTNSLAPTPTPLPAAVSYEKTLYPVERGSIAEQYEMDGVVTPRIQDTLFFRASGYISRAPFKGGDAVKKGDVLAELQIDDLLNQLQQAEIDLETAEMNLVNQKKDRDYAIERAKHQVNLAQLNLDQIRASGATKYQLAIAEENLALNQLALQEATERVTTYEEQAVKRTQLVVDRLKSQIAERQIVAPYDGVLFYHRLVPGMAVEAFEEVMTIGDPSELVIRANRVYDLVSKLNNETEATLYLNSEDKEGYPLQFLSNFVPTSATEETSNKNQTNADFFYFAMPTPPDLSLIPVGKNVDVTVVTGRNDDALILPKAVIREFGGLKFVIVREGDKQRRIEVQTGLESTTGIEVIGDIKEGDQVVGP